MIEEKKFIINEDSGESVEINEEKFKFVQKDKKIHDVKFNSKPTTFFKDSMKRFVKSKPALIGGIIVGLIIISAIIVPEVLPKGGAYDIGKNDVGGDVNERYIQPKLFPSGTGFWDGTLNKKHIMYDIEKNTPVGFRKGVYKNLVTYEETSNTVSEHGRNGYINVYAIDDKNGGNLYSEEIAFDFTNNYSLSITSPILEVEDYLTSPYKVLLVTKDDNYLLTSDYINDENLNININEKLESLGYDLSNDLTAKIKFEVKRTDLEKVDNRLVSSIIISSDSKDEKVQEKLKSISFNSGNEVLLREVGKPGFWSSTSGLKPYKVEYTYCDFKYDQYEDVYGVQPKTYSYIDIVQLQTQKHLKINLTPSDCKATSDPEILNQRFKTTSKSTPIAKVVEQIGDAKWNPITKKWEGYKLVCDVYGYRLYGYDKMPTFLFGTNTFRKDYLKLITTGLRTSILLAIVVASINIIIGLIWGSISGYFGGWTDILMERFCEILSGLPTTVLITLCILYGREWKWGDSADVIALMMALFLTGWMGVAHQTRTQFYRFKNREYVLASRTLGSKDARLIFRHILPNSMGTIITGSILMIPSVIYTEASIAYLKLGLTNQVMFGVILAQANVYYKGDNMYLLIVPTVIMALLLISFNLFGNGLREAFNPSLKGSE